jgi:hypothetical protein
VSWFGSWYASWLPLRFFLSLLFSLWLLSPSVREGLILAGGRSFSSLFLRLVLDPGVGSLFCILCATVALLGVSLWHLREAGGICGVPLQDGSHVG